MKILNQKFEEAYQEYAEDILRHIYFRVGTWEVAKDLTQETFFKAWRSLAEGKVAEIKNFKAFFYKIANNLVIDYYRGQKEEVSLEEKEEEVETIAVVQGDQEREVDFQIEKKKLERHLSELKDEYKQVLVLRFINDLSIKEISQVTNKTRGSVRILIHRALQALKKKYER